MNGLTKSKLYTMIDKAAGEGIETNTNSTLKITAADTDISKSNHTKSKIHDTDGKVKNAAKQASGMLLTKLTNKRAIGKSKILEPEKEDARPPKPKYEQGKKSADQGQKTPSVKGAGAKSIFTSRFLTRKLSKGASQQSAEGDQTGRSSLTPNKKPSEYVAGIVSFAQHVSNLGTDLQLSKTELSNNHSPSTGSHTNHARHVYPYTKGIGNHDTANKKGSVQSISHELGVSKGLKRNSLLDIFHDPSKIIVPIPETKISDSGVTFKEQSGFVNDSTFLKGIPTQNYFTNSGQIENSLVFNDESTLEYKETKHNRTLTRKDSAEELLKYL